MPALRVLVADEESAARRRIVLLVRSLRNLEACEEASSGRQAVSKSKILKPHVVILGAQMTVANGLFAAQQIRRFLPKTHILLLGSDGYGPLEQELKRIGANGWIPKSAGHLVFLSAIQEAFEMEMLFLGEPPPSGTIN